MFKLIVLSSMLALSNAVPNYGYGYGSGIYGYAPAPAAAVSGPLATHMTGQYLSEIPVPSRGYATPTNVYADSASPPIQIFARTHSRPVAFHHEHVPAPGSFVATASQDGPQVRVHTVTKPVIQEIREIVAPQRIVRQQVLPVSENIQTLVSRRVAAAIPALPVAIAPAPIAVAAAPAFALAPAFRAF